MLTVAAAGRRVLLVFDDLHWADRPTLALLRALLRRPAFALVVGATSRVGPDGNPELRDLAAELRRDAAFESLQLEGLDVAATAELVSARTATVPDPRFVAWIHARTCGNPFFVAEVLRSLSDTTGLAVVSEPEPRVLAGARVPDGVRDLVAQRLARLPAAAGEALRIAAVAGPRFSLRLIDTLLAGEAIAGLDAALEAGMIVEEPERPGDFGFVHTLVREAIYESMTAARRTAWHLRVAETLEATGAPAGVLAHHFMQSRSLGGPVKAVQWSIVAAEDAERATAWEAEIEHYERALRVLDDAGSRDEAARCELLLRLGARQVTHGSQARDTFARAAAIAQRQGWPQLLARAAIGRSRIFQYGILDDGAVKWLEAALLALGDEDSAQRGELLARLAQTLAFDGRAPERCETLSQEAIEMARRIGDADALRRALDTRARALPGPAYVRERIDLLSDGLRGTPDESHPDRSCSSSVSLFELQLQVGDLAAAQSSLQTLAGMVSAHRLAGTYYDGERLRLTAVQSCLAGRFAESEALAHAALKHFTADPEFAGLQIALALSMRLEQGRGDDLRAGVAHESGRSANHTPWRAAGCLLDALAGRRAAAHAELRALAFDECAAIPRLDEWLPAIAMLADACAVLRDRDTAATLARLLAPYADRNALFFYASAPLAPVAAPLGRLLSLLGRSDEAVELLEGATARAELIGAPVWLAHCTAHLADALTTRGASGDIASAAASREHASAMARDLGLLRLARELRLAGPPL